MLFVNKQRLQIPFASIVRTFYLFFKNIKFNLKAEVKFKRCLTDGVTNTSGAFVTPAIAIYNEHKVDDAYDEARDNLLRRLDAFQNNGSGWTIEQIVSFNIQTAAFDQISAGSFVPTPKFLAKKQALLNIKNHDDNCFAYSVLAHSHPVTTNQDRA